MKAILLLMVFSGCAYAQQVQVKDVEFAAIIAVEEAEKYYNSLMAEEPEDSDNTAKYSEYRGAIGTPEKFIMGTDGDIQLRGVGHAGSDDAEYYKLKAMVEVAKAHTKDL